MALCVFLLCFCVGFVSVDSQAGNSNTDVDTQKRFELQLGDVFALLEGLKEDFMRQFGPYIQKLTGLITTILDKIHALDHKVGEIAMLLKDCRMDLVKMLYYAIKYINEIHRCMDYANLSDGEVSTMKGQYRKKQYGQLVAYINQLDLFLKETTSSLEKFKEAYKNTRGECKNAVSVSETKLREIMRSRRSMVWTSVAVGASFFVCYYKFVGRTPESVIFNFVVSGSLIVGSYYIASYFDEPTQEIRKLFRSFDEIHDTASHFSVTIVEHLAEKIETFKTDVKFMNDHIQNKIEPTSFDKVFNLMRSHIRPIQELAEQEEEQIRRKIVNLFKGIVY